MTTTPTAVKRLSEKNRNDIVRLLEAVEKETNGEISTLAELKEMLVEDDSLLRNTESIEVPEDAPEMTKGIPEGDDVVM